MARRILVVEDEAPIREMVCFVLEQNGFQPVEAEDYDSAVNQLNEPWPDLILLDWMLPGGSGIQFIKHLKRESMTRDIPVVMLTARGEEEDRVRGLETGADDYVPKPFEPKELVLRINNILKRTAREKDIASKLVFHGIVYNLEKGELKTAAGETIHITPVERTLLNVLGGKPGEVHTREELAEILGVAENLRTVDVQITRLRKKIEIDTKNPRYLQTVRGKGYMLISE